MNKLEELLASRRFWVAVVGVVLATAFHLTGKIPSDQAVDWIELALGFYAGSVGLEHLIQVYGQHKQPLIVVTDDEGGFIPSELDVS